MNAQECVKRCTLKGEKKEKKGKKKNILAQKHGGLRLEPKISFCEWMFQYIKSRKVRSAKICSWKPAT